MSKWDRRLVTLISLSVHLSMLVSGTVTAIEERVLLNGSKCLAVALK